MDESAQAINAFLVEVFGEILRTEERCLAAGPSNDLSLTELHVIEAVAACCREEVFSLPVVFSRPRSTCWCARAIFSAGRTSATAASSAWS